MRRSSKDTERTEDKTSFRFFLEVAEDDDDDDDAKPLLLALLRRLPLCGVGGGGNTAGPWSLLTERRDSCRLRLH